MPITFTYSLQPDGDLRNLSGAEGGDAVAIRDGAYAVVVDSPTTDDVVLTQIVQSSSTTSIRTTSVQVLEDSAVALLNNGNYAIAGERDDGVHIWLTSINGAANRVATNDPGTSNADVAALKSGGFVVVCEDVVGRGRTGVDLKFYSAGGTLTKEISLSNGVVGSYADPQVTVLRDGNVAVTFTASGGGVREVFYAVYSSTGTQVCAPTRVATGTNDSAPVITTLVAGFAIAFARVEADGDRVIGVQAFGATGILSSDFAVVEHPGGLSLPEITAMPDNVLAVSGQLVTGGGSYVAVVDTFRDVASQGTLTSGDVVSMVSTGGGQLVSVAHGAGPQGTQLQTLQMVRVGQQVDSPDGFLGANWTKTDDMPSHMTGAARSDTFNAGGGDDILIGRGGSDRLNGGDGDDRLIGGDGTDNLNGGLGHDIVDYSGAAGRVVATLQLDSTGTQITSADGDGQSDRMTGIEELIGSRFNDNLISNGGGAILRGEDGNDVLTDVGTGVATLFGDAGDDTLNGSRMVGGVGDDTYIVDSTADVIVEIEGEGTDTVFSSVSLTLINPLENLTLTGAANLNVTGNFKSNILIGNAGNNLLAGGGGADRMVGGAGDDTYVVDNVGDVVIEVTGEGTDTVRTSVSYSLGGQSLENMTLIGTGDINATGNSKANILIGNAGNNTLDGKSGVDRMVGGAGNDTYIVDNVGDVIIEVTGEGTDTVLTSVSYSLAVQSLENMTLTGTANINATGNSKANILIGNSGNNTLDGKSGVDRMSGGAGNDIYIVDNVGDVVIEVTGEGTDEVRTSVSYSLGGQSLENMTLTGTGAINATGNSKANILIGNSGNNTLDGKGGIDRMVGGAGNDTYVVDNVGDVIIEVTGEGTDTVLTSVSYSLAVQSLENMTLTGTGNINATGNSKANILIGNAGNNVLDGKSGVDRMSGGAGNDTYIVDNVSDVIIEVTGEGTDTVLTSVSYSLAVQSLENMTLTGTGNINATGNSKANILIGNAGNNVLDGKSGVDHMTGGLGNDTYVVDSNSDVIVEARDEGTDLILSSVSFAMKVGSFVENLTLTGTGDINVTGNGIGNILTGNSGNNILDGAASTDTLIGGGGRDTLTGGTGSDTFVFRALSDSTAAASDLITDLSNSDFIDLSAIDGNTARAGVQGFAIVDAFTGTAGQLTLPHSASTNITTLNLDVNGDRVADMTIRITGDHEDFDNFLFGGG